ncbi:uncharacterized protein [Paramormyrops kingsleyae]|uniref:uncharacterized protein isoform X2 n=1 Tax=Paramormyrops kingsleyae TaxID=1676925 RepID=UPI003B976625
MTSESGTTISIPIGAWEKDLSSTTDTEFRTQTGLARQHKIMTTVKHFSTKSTGTEMIMIVKASLNEEKLLSADLSAGLEFAKERLRHMLPAKVEEATLIVEGENLMVKIQPDRSNGVCFLVRDSLGCTVWRQSQRGEVALVWTITEERCWVCWKKDDEDRAARQGGKRKA